MALLRNNFEGGTNSTGMTTGNTGGTGNNAFTAVEVAAIFSNGWARSGTLSMKPPSTAATGLGRWSASGVRDAAFRGYFYCTASHASDWDFYRIDVATQVALLVRFTGANTLRLRNVASSSNIWTASNSFPTNTEIRIEVLCEIGTTSSNGRVRLAYYAGDGTTPIEDSGWITGQNLRGDTGTIDNLRIGKTSGASYSGDFYLDDVAINTGGDYAEFIGPDVVDVPPTAVVTNEGVYHLLDATASTDGMGGTLAFTIDPDDDVIDLGDGRFLVPNATETYTVTVEESPSGLDDTDDVEVFEVSGTSGDYEVLYWDDNESDWV